MRSALATVCFRERSVMPALLLFDADARKILLLLFVLMLTGAI